MRFPDGFVWGAATSAYQIEGAVDADGRGRSIWDTFAHTPGTIADGTTGDVACDHYHRYREDVAILRDLGVDAYRFSVAWPRVQPVGSGPANRAGLDFYSRLVDELLAAGVVPVMTLYHWDLPQPLEDAGGWRNRDTAARFAEYAGIVTSVLGDRVRTVTTLNEPWCAAFLGYGNGVHAPGVRDDAGALRAAHHLLLAHGLGAQAVRAAAPGAAVSVTLNPANVRAASEEAADRVAARNAQLAQNEIFLDPLLRGALNRDLLATTESFCDWSFVADGDLATIAAPLDVLGVNYYFPQVVGARPDPAAAPGHWPGMPGAYEHVPAPPHTAMGWRVEPVSFTELLRRLAQDYPGTRFVVTENGASYDDVVGADGAVHDADRVAYVRDHIAAVADAIAAGVDVRGYFLWSLLDNFEWAWGLSKRFGIVHVDFDSQQRTLKDSAHEYRRIIAASRTPAGEHPQP